MYLPMMSPTQLIQYLRFALDELTHRNGQFDFEALAQEIVRSRIASNIVTATGQVSAKGDQGRDAETYTSYLKQQLGPHTAFLAHVSDTMIAVCCTIQQEDLKDKFVKDAKKVMDSGAPIERIYAMCSAPVSVGVRHDIEAAAEAASGVPVELLDGKWIAEQLADNELIWIARRYLELSDAMMPLPEPSASEVDDYTELRARWRMAATPRPLPGDFHELRAGLRMAAEPGPCRADLPMWLNRMEQMLQPHIDPELRARVQYELAVGALIGQRDLRPMDDQVRTYFLEKVGWDHPLRLNDASVLLTYLYGMVASGRTTLLPDDLTTWHSALLTHLEGLLDEHPAPTRRAYLRFTIGCLKLQPNPQLIKIPNAPRDLPEIDVIRKEHDEKGIRGVDGLLDPSGAIKEWQTLLGELAPSGNLFPLEQLANTVSLMTGVLIDVNGWDELVTALDRALTTKSGMAAAAAQAFARAQKLMHLDRPLAAIQALHAAKVDWFAGDSLHETFDALMGLSRCYMELRLPMAAKQYALAACHLCVATDRDDVRDLFPTALTEVARVEFYSGRWLAAARAAVTALNAFGLHFVLTEDSEPSEDVTFVLQVLKTVVAAARDINPELTKAIRPLFADEQGALEILTEDTPTEDTDWWLEKGRELQLLDHPFSDAGVDRSHRFSALGLSWKMDAASDDYRSWAATERLAAAAAVLSVELADVDLCLLPGDVDINIRGAKVGLSTLDDETSLPSPKNGWTWNIELGESSSWLDDPDTVVKEITSVLLAILGERSLLPDDQLKDRVIAIYKRRGIGHVFVGAAYDRLLENAFEGIPGRGGLQWPRRGGLKWPHFASVVVCS